MAIYLGVAWALYTSFFQKLVLTELLTLRRFCSLLLLCSRIFNRAVCDAFLLEPEPWVLVRLSIPGWGNAHASIVSSETDGSGV